MHLESEIEASAQSLKGLHKRSRTVVRLNKFVGHDSLRGIVASRLCGSVAVMLPVRHRHREMRAFSVRHFCGLERSGNPKRKTPRGIAELRFWSFGWLPSATDTPGSVSRSQGKGKQLRQAMNFIPRWLQHTEYKLHATTMTYTL